jgi:hypothetical protein
MSIRLLIAAAAVVAIPMAAIGQDRDTSPRRNSTAKRYCEANSDIASRLNNRRRCFTKAEYDAMKMEARQTVDRIQNMKATMGR